MKVCVLGVMLLASSAAQASSVGASIKDLDDGTRASVVKEMSKLHRYEDDKAGKNGSSRSANQSNSCDMNVASPAAPTVGMPTPRKAITVVTGNIVQICNK